MRIEKKEEDTFIEFDNFNEVKEVFEEVIKTIEDEDSEGYLVIESKEDLEEFRKMLIEAYYELKSEDESQDRN